MVLTLKLNLTSKELTHLRVKYKGEFLDPVEMFGMAYPYYIKKAGNKIAFSTDEGLFVLKLT